MNTAQRVQKCDFWLCFQETLLQMFSVAVGNTDLCSLVNLEWRWSNNFLLLVLAIHNSFTHINTDKKYKTLKPRFLLLLCIISIFKLSFLYLLPSHQSVRNLQQNGFPIPNSTLHLSHFQQNSVNSWGKEKKKKKHLRNTSIYPFSKQKMEISGLVCLVFLKEAMFSTEKQFRQTFSLAVLLQSWHQDYNFQLDGNSHLKCACFPTVPIWTHGLR